MLKRRSEIEIYLNHVSRFLTCSGSEKESILKRVRSMLEDIPGSEDMSYPELCAAAGTPENWAENYIVSAPGDVIREFQGKKHQRYVLAGILLAVAVVVLSLTIHTYVKQQDILDGHYIDTMAEEGDPPPVSSMYAEF